MRKREGASQLNAAFAAFLAKKLKCRSSTKSIVNRKLLFSERIFDRVSF